MTIHIVCLNNINKTNDKTYMFILEINYTLVCNGFITEDQCREACSCDMNNTVIFNSVTGDCLCKTGWKGQNCSEDVNECQENLRRCDTNLYQV